jgi:hypothetical protein
MPVNAIAMPFSFAAPIDSSTLIDPPRLETGVRLAICDSLSLATVVFLNDLGASAFESPNRKPDPSLVPWTLIVFNGCLSHLLDFTYD